jgi:hypothetical protein
MIQHETRYQQMQVHITDAYRLAQDTRDAFLEHLLGMCLMEIEERFKQIETERPAKTRRRRTQLGLEIVS